MKKDAKGAGDVANDDGHGSLDGQRLLRLLHGEVPLHNLGMVPLSYINIIIK